MTKETAGRIAKSTSDTGIQKWCSLVGRFVVQANPGVLDAAGKACGDCPFRHNPDSGCIGEECPVHAVRKTINLATKRAMNGVREIFRSKYAARVRDYVAGK